MPPDSLPTQSVVALVHEREGTLPDPLKPERVQTVANLGKEVMLEVWWPRDNDEPMWSVRQRGGRQGWMRREHLIVLRDALTAALDGRI